MAVITMRQMLEAGVHFGHQTRRWNPKMKRFIFGERNGIYIIDLEQTLTRVERAYGYVRDLVAGGGVILFVGTKKQAQDPVRSYAEKCGMPFVNERWLGGMLTNFDTISKRVGKMLEYERMRDSGEFEAMPKKEALLLTREMEKLQRNLGGLRGMTRKPDAIFVLDTKKEHIAVTEANKLGIPVVAVVDTNVDPELVQYPIPGNDDAIRANSLLARVIADAVEEGRFIAAKRDPGNAPVVRSAEQEAAFAAQQTEARNAAARAQAEREARLAAARDATPADEPAEAPATGPAAPSPTPSPAASERPAEPPTAPTQPSRTPSRRPSTCRRRRRRPRRPTTTDPTERGELIEMAFTAKDVQALRQATGAGMMDAKKALEANDGDMEAAKNWLREQGLAASAKRDDRENTQGVVALVVDDQVGALVELKCETDFVAASEHFKLEAQELARLVAAKGDDAVGRPPGPPRGPQDHAQGEDRGRPRRARGGRAAATSSTATCTSRAAAASTASSSCWPAGPSSWPTTSPCTSPSPARSTCPATTCPADVVEAERQTLEAITRNEGKPEQAIPKIVEGRLGGFFKTVALLDQPYAKDDKQTIAQLLGQRHDRRVRPGRDRLTGGRAPLAPHRLQAVR